MTDEAELRAARVDVLLEKARRLQQSDTDGSAPVSLPPAPASLPRMSPATFPTCDVRAVVTTVPSVPLASVGRVVVRVAPGWSVVIARAYHGCDATAAMTGGVNLHTEAAERMARGMAVARLMEDDGDVEDDWVLNGSRNVLLEADESTVLRGSRDKQQLWKDEVKTQSCE